MFTPEVLLWAFEKLVLTSGTTKLSDIYEDFYEKFVCWKGDLIEMMVCATQGEKTPAIKTKTNSNHGVHRLFSENSEQKRKKKKDMIQSY